MVAALQTLVPGVIPDPSGLVVDGPTFIRSLEDTTGANIGMATLVSFAGEGLPIQLRNLEVRDSDFYRILDLASGGGPLSIEVSDIVVKV